METSNGICHTEVERVPTSIGVYFKAVRTLISVVEEFSGFIESTLKKPLNQYPELSEADVNVTEEVPIPTLQNAESCVGFVNLILCGMKAGHGRTGDTATVPLNNPDGSELSPEAFVHIVHSLFGLRAVKIRLFHDPLFTQELASDTQVNSLSEKTLYVVPHYLTDGFTCTVGAVKGPMCHSIKLKDKGKTMTVILESPEDFLFLSEILAKAPASDRAQPYSGFVNVILQGLKPGHGRTGVKGMVLLNNPVGSDELSLEAFVHIVQSLFGLRGVQIRLFHDRLMTRELDSGTQICSLSKKAVFVCPHDFTGGILCVPGIFKGPLCRYVNVEGKGEKGTLLLENPEGEFLNLWEILAQPCSTVFYSILQDLGFKTQALAAMDLLAYVDGAGDYSFEEESHLITSGNCASAVLSVPLKQVSLSQAKNISGQLNIMDELISVHGCTLFL